MELKIFYSFGFDSFQVPVKLAGLTCSCGISLLCYFLLSTLKSSLSLVLLNCDLTLWNKTKVCAAQKSVFLFLLFAFDYMDVAPTERLSLSLCNFSAYLHNDDSE